jgi:uncharacterized membrane protein YdjX (TVP38/TMEM64 family)
VSVSPAPTVAGPAAVRAVRSRVIGLVVMLTFIGLGLVLAAALSAESLADTASELGALTAPALAAVGALLVALMVPAGLVAGAAGFALGTAVGTVVAVVATTLGAALAAYIGRAVGTPAARSAFGPRIQRTVMWFEARPARTVVLSRVLPGMPFNITSTVLGFTRIPLLTVGVGTALGYLPRSFAYAALGGSLRDLGSPEAKAAIAASVAIAIVSLVLPQILLRKSAEPSAERAL